MEKVDSRGLTEQEFLICYAEKKYEKPSLTADIVILAREQESLYVLLVRRKNHPFLGCWALPGGFASPRETIEETAARELEEETGLSGIPLIPVGLYSKPGRDPRGWVVSQAYAALVQREKLQVQAGDDAGDARWFRIAGTGADLRLTEEQKGFDPGKLAFDHEEILQKALAKVHALD